jgi:hypothetical protein
MGSSSEFARFESKRVAVGCQLIPTYRYPSIAIMGEQVGI